MSFSKKIAGFHVKISVLFIRLAGWLRSGDMKKDKRKEEIIKAKILTDYFTLKYLPAVGDLTQKPVTTEMPETIWQFWDNPIGKTTPKIVKSCVESVERFKGDFEHKILDNSTLGNYSDLPAYVFDRLKGGKMSYAHFADLLRLNLLKNHGGIWMDATDYMTNFVPKYIVNQDFFVFLTDKLTHFPYAFMQNCFIRAKKGSFLCEAWYEMCVEYWKNETKRFDYFQHQLMFKSLVNNNSTAKDLFAGMPHRSEDETHLLAGNNLFEKFDINQWEGIKNASFFQKTIYKTSTGIANENDYRDTYFSKLSEGNL